MNAIHLRVNGRGLPVVISQHFKERAITRKITPEAVAEALQHGFVIRLGDSITKAMRLGDGLGLADRFGPFPRLDTVIGQVEDGTRLLVCFRRHGQLPLHLQLVAYGGELTALTCYKVDGTQGMHPTGLASMSAWQHHGSVIEASIRTWAAARKVAA